MVTSAIIPSPILSARLPLTTRATESLALEAIKEKVLAGERINEAEALELYRSPDLLSVGALAHAVNWRKNKGIVYYNINRHINPTNICVLSCKFCAFARKPGEEGAYAYTIDEILSKAQVAVDQGATEIHMVGGLHPRWTLQHYLDMLGALKEKFASLHIKGFTAVEIDWLAKKSRKPVAEVLRLLRSAGLGSLPGGGAEIFHDGIRTEITAKLGTEEWLGIHKAAHEMGMHSNCTMLYGHVEAYEHRVYHLRRLRELQDETQGFNAFIPLSFQPHNNDMGISRYTFGFDDLKNLAVARIYLDNFMHIKSYWVMMGQDIAQLGLYFGANDLDGTVIQEKISNMAGGRGGMHMTQADLELFIRKTGHTPVERDTLYHPIRRPTKKDEQQAVPADSVVRPEQQPSWPSLFNDLSSLSRPSLAELLPLADATLYLKVAQLAEALSKKHHHHRVSFASSLDWQVQNKGAAEINSFARKLKQLEKKRQASVTAEKPTLLNIDLATFASAQALCELDFQDLLGLVAYGKEQSGLTVMLSGLHTLTALVLKSGLSFTAAFKELKAAGLDSFQTAYNEAVNELTEQELLAVYSAAQTAGILTLAKVELRVGKNCRKLKWQEFLTRILAFRELSNRENPLLGLSIAVAAGSKVTPAEFLQALALARIAAPELKHIGVSLLAVPSLCPPKASSSQQYPEEKLTPLLAIAGASDLGCLPQDSVLPEAIFEELISAGFTPTLRDAAFLPWGGESPSANEPFSLRHIPRLRV